jgi:hypothetical protein
MSNKPRGLTFWKRRAEKQQKVIMTLRRHNDRLTNDRNACAAALDNFRQALKEVCPHDKIDTKRFSIGPYCDRCKEFVSEEEIKAVSLDGVK